MRTWGRVYSADGSTYEWVPVTSAPGGDETDVWLTTLCQVLQLNPNESPFYAQYGIPAYDSVRAQVPPDVYVAQTQQQFSGYFRSLVIIPDTSPSGDPIYTLDIVTLSGRPISRTVPR